MDITPFLTCVWEFLRKRWYALFLPHETRDAARIRNADAFLKMTDDHDGKRVAVIGAKAKLLKEVGVPEDQVRDYVSNELLRPQSSEPLLGKLLTDKTP